MQPYKRGGFRGCHALPANITRISAIDDNLVNNANEFKTYRSGSTTRNVNIGRLKGLKSVNSGAVSLREAAIENIGGSGFSTSWGTVKNSAELRNIYTQVATDYGFSTGM
jgi:hypothetical protein